MTVDMIDPDEVSTLIVLDDLQLKKLETKTSNG